MNTSMHIVRDSTSITSQVLIIK